MGKPRWVHSVALNEEEETALQEIITKMKAKYGRFGITDIVKAGITRFKYSNDFEREILKHKDSKLKK